MSNMTLFKYLYCVCRDFLVRYYLCIYLGIMYLSKIKMIISQARRCVASNTSA